jgi:hypothetical protein
VFNVSRQVAASIGVALSASVLSGGITTNLAAMGGTTVDAAARMGAQVDAFRAAFWVPVVVAGIGLIAAFWLPARQPAGRVSLIDSLAAAEGAEG